VGARGCDAPGDPAVKARVQNYRSVNDSTIFDVEPDKTILVGANEAGKLLLLGG